MGLLIASDGRPHLVWRMIGFGLFFAAAVAPLLLIDHALAQFALGSVVLVGCLWLWGRRVDRLTLADYGLRRDARMAAETLAGLGIGVMAVAGIWAVSAALGWAGTPRYEASVWLGPGFWQFLAKALLVAFWEETLFRGFLLTNIRVSARTRWGEANGLLVAVALSSLLFGLAHAATSNFSFAAFAILTINGAVLAVPMALTGRLGLSIGMHAAWNFAQSKLFGFTMSGNASVDPLLGAAYSGPAWWSGGGYGPEAGLSGVFGLALMALAAWAVARRRPADLVRSPVLR